MCCMENFNAKSPRQKQVEYLQEMMMKVKILFIESAS